METVHDIRARKRTEIGLSPNRPTANVVLQRPPENQTPMLLRWMLVGLLLAMICATTLLVVARFFNSPTSWSWMREQFSSRVWTDTTANQTASENSLSTEQANTISGDKSQNTIGHTQPVNRPSANGQRSSLAQTSSPYQLIWEDNFNPPHLNLALGEGNQSPYKWFNPQEGVYRMSVEANQATLSTVGLGALGPHLVEVDLKIMPDRGTIGGYAGIFGRYQNNDNFFLFLIDSQAQFQVQSRQDGEWRTHQAWTLSPALYGATQLNTLAIEDTAETVRLYGNNILLFEFPTLQLPPGDIGLVGGMPGQDGVQLGQVQIDFNAIRFYGSG